MAEPIERRIDSLSDMDRRTLIGYLAESHPRVAAQLLDRIDAYHQREAVRAAMPPHPFTGHERISSATLCYYGDEASCLRPADDPLHTTAVDPTEAGQ